MEIKELQAALGTVMGGQTTNVDFCFIIDGTGSMSPIIETVKGYVKGFYPTVKKALNTYGKKINQCRAKVIVFRDYYCDGDQAMAESDFYLLPDDEDAFTSYVSNIEAKGGDDAPENGLEALALAMKSDWVKEGISRRHIILLFTDAPAHPFEKSSSVTIPNYPKDMPKNCAQLEEAWMGASKTSYDMDPNAQRLILFAPDTEPWCDLGVDFENTIYRTVDADKGVIEIDADMITDFLGRSMK